MKDPTYQLLLCGTRYGKSYLPAIFNLPNVTLVGILAQGSRRSIVLAQQCGVPLYRCVDDINHPIDLACVAIGHEAGFQIAKALLAKKVAVLIEHPVNAQRMQQLLSIAKQNNTYCHINSHFPEITPIAQYIAQAKQQQRQNAPLLIQLQCNSRTLFSTLDILMRITGSQQLTQLTMLEAKEDYLCCQCLLGATLCHISYQKWRHTEDNSQDAPLGHQINITYPHGHLLLASSFGPWLWLPLATGLSPPQMFVQHIDNQADHTLAQLLAWRAQANTYALEQLIACLSDKSSPTTQKVPYLNNLCHLWQELFSQLGYVERSTNDGKNS